MPKKKCATRARKDGTKYQGCWTESAEETKKASPKEKKTSTGSMMKKLNAIGIESSSPKAKPKKKITYIPKAEGDATRKSAGDFLSGMESKGAKVASAVSKTKDVKRAKPKPKAPSANLEQQLEFAEKETDRLEKLGIAKYSSEKGLTAKKLKERIKAVNKYTSVSGTKAELIERLAWQEAMKKMNTSNLRSAVLAERTEKRKKGEEEGKQTKKREIAQAKIAGVRPTQEQMNEMRRENAQRNIGLSMMTGGAYGNIRADSDLNFAHRHRVALSWQGGGFDF